MASTFVVTARGLENGKFTTEPGISQYIVVPQGRNTYDESNVQQVSVWRKQLAKQASGPSDPLTGMKGNILFFVHGYNNDIQTMLWRTRKLQETLDDQGWKGVVVAFDWPSDNSTLNYLEDRSDAAEVAQYLTNECLQLLVQGQNPPSGVAPCHLDVHLIGHSTGAYVIMEAFSQADKNGAYFRSDWRVGQVVFIGGDVSSDSLAAQSQWAAPMYKRIMRLTNYSNGCDKVLAVSNAKRLGASPRAGRVGLGPDVDAKAVNVDCTDYFKTLNPKQSKFIGTFCHSWHIGDTHFALDLAMTLEGTMDRRVLPTRKAFGDSLSLTVEPGERPNYEAGWFAESPETA